MKYGYARVSTVHQDLKGQMKRLKEEGCEQIFSEKFTGTKKDRPQFKILLDLLQEGDTLVVTKLDRFARSVSDGNAIIKDLFSKGVKVHVLNMGILEDTSNGRLLFNIMSAFAEFERDLIVERSQEGREHAKATNPNYKEGRPKKFSKERLDAAMKLLEEKSYRQVERITSISRATLVREKQKRNAEKEKAAMLS